jgi:FkbM family methyltransferase
MSSKKPLNFIVRKIRYLVQIVPLVKNVTNWYQIPLQLLFSSRQIILKLKTGERFKIGHYLDALTIKEIYIDKDYKVSFKNPKTIIDIGANIGTFSVLQAKLNPRTNIFSFEPSLKTFKLLLENIKLNHVKNVKTYKLGVADSVGTRTFYSHPASGLSSLNKKRGGMVKNKIKTTTLSDIFKNNKITKCDLLKMDCEGAEYEILFNTPTRIFKKIDKMVIEYHDMLTEYTHKELKDFLKQKGYKVKLVAHELETDIGIIFAKK